MGVKYFGQFLIERGVITAAQLLAAVDLQAGKNLDFGGAGVKLGILSRDNAQRLNDKQRHTDKRIGELAQESGFLSAAQVEQVLTFQRNSHLQIGEALLAISALTRPDLDRELAAFATDQAPYAVEKLTLPAGTVHAPAIEAFVDLGRKLLLRLSRVSCKVGVPYPLEEPALRGECAVSIGVHGEAGLFEAALVVSQATAREVNQGLLGVVPDNATVQDDIDALKEFLNVVAGNVCAKLAQSGQAYEISPPRVHSGGVQRGQAQMLVCPLHAAEQLIAFGFTRR